MPKSDDSPMLRLALSKGEEEALQPAPPGLRLGAHAEPPPPPLPPESPRRVLVVDDDEGVRALIVRILGQTGHPCVVRTARDGLEGGIEIPVFRPHLVILDVNMPGVHGDELCRWVKTSGCFPNTKILMITGDRRDKRLDTALQAGADGWLPKPFKVAEFVSKVTDLLANVA